MSKRKYTEEQLIEAVKQSRSVRQVLSRLGLREAGGNYKSVGNHIKELGIDTSNLKGKGWLKGEKNLNPKPAKPLKDILIDGSYTQTYKLKYRLIKEGLLDYKCSIKGCSITNTWNGKQINLRLDHINGKNDDNRLENLRLVCPNCDSQSETYCGKNKKRL